MQKMPFYNLKNMPFIILKLMNLTHSITKRINILRPTKITKLKFDGLTLKKSTHSIKYKLKRIYPLNSQAFNKTLTSPLILQLN